MSEVQKQEGGSIKHDIAVPVARVPEFVARANRLVELMIPGARPVPFGHLGDGNIHYNVSQPPGMDRAVFLRELGSAQRRGARDRARSWRLDQRRARDRTLEARSPAPRQRPLELELMRKIKAAFDPNSILNPGKLL